jgi:hypothetical protein
MPDTNGKLSAEEKKEVTDLINRRWQGRSQACPICGDTRWIISDYIVRPITMGPDGQTLLGGPAYPNILVISQGCGYTFMMNTMVLGLSHLTMTKKE